MTGFYRGATLEKTGGDILEAMMNPRRVNCTCVAACLGIAIAWSGACRHSAEAPVQPLTGVDRQTLDEQVIEAALLDLAISKDDDTETLRREQPKAGIVFSSECVDRVGTLRQEVSSAESEKWKSLAGTDLRAAREAGLAVLSRIENKQLFKPFRSKDPRISLWEDLPASTQPARRFFSRDEPRPICAGPPGYADGNRVAVVMFGFSWSIHSGNATYVLRFDGRKWNVISRHFSYYV